MTQKEYLNWLPKKTLEQLEKSNQERINFIQAQKFIKHTKAQKLFKKLNDLINEPKRDRIRSMLLLGEPNNGKSFMLKKFYEMNIYRNEEDIEYFEHVMLLESPARADLHDLYNRIFQFFLVPYRKDEPISERENKVLHYCNVNKVKMIIIDEIQNTLTGSITRQMEFMNGIKNLSNKLKIPIVLVGTPKSISLVSSDHQLKSRFVPTRIKKWQLDKNYLSLLRAIEKTLPLKKPSQIYENEKLFKEILELSDGLIGDIITICDLLAIKAIESGTEKIEYNMLNDIEYVPAYDREGVIFADEI